MKRVLIIILIISLTIVSGCLKSSSFSNISEQSSANNKTWFADKKTIDNSFFFNSNVSKLDYQGKFLFNDDIEREVKLYINEVANLKDGKLYELKLDSLKGIPNDRLKLGLFYVQKDKIYKIEPTEVNLKKLTENEEVPYESVIVCQDKELKDTLSEDKPGFHQYIKVNGDKREYHSYNNNVSTGYYESFFWEKNKGLINFRSGHGAERDSMELKLSGTSNQR